MIRAAGYATRDWREFARTANADVQIWVNIETLRAISEIDEILESGVTGIVLGIFDLSVELGYEGEHDHPDVQARLTEVLRKAVDQEVDVVAVCFETEPDRITRFCREWRAKGCRIFTGLMDRTYLRLAYEAQRSGFEAALS